MLTTQEAGKSWDKNTIGRIVLVSPEVYPEYGEIVELFLDAQPYSWSGICNRKEMLDAIANGYYTPWLYLTPKGYRGMMLTSLQNYCYGGSIKIEFLSCKNFYIMMQMEKALERQALVLGRNFIEAVAHPVLAKYAMKKRGWTTPGVAIRKDLRVSRRN